MPLTIRHLNADTTFLLTFTPPPTSAPSPHHLSPWLSATPPPTPTSTGSFSILLDPWLTGPTKVFHQRFAVSRRRIPPCVSSLREIPEPDLVVISQAKPDHCNEDTLRQLPAEGSKTVILAHPAAAKIIRSWRHFKPESRVQALARYDHRDPARREATIRRIVLPPSTSSGAPGEVTVAFMSDAWDVTGVHTAIGITYRPPTSTVLFPATPTRPGSALSVPLSPTPAALLAAPLTPPPDSPRSFHSMSMSSYTAPSDRPMSIIYTPHGIPYRLIKAYASTHLVAEAALPLDCLIHPFDRVENLWWLGGVIVTGFPGGQEIANNLLARYWVSAHDEDKEVGGISTKPVRTRRYDRHQAQLLMARTRSRDNMRRDYAPPGNGPGDPGGGGGAGGGLGHPLNNDDKSSGGKVLVFDAPPETEMVTLDPGEDLHV